MLAMLPVLYKIPNLTDQVKRNIINKTEQSTLGCWLYTGSLSQGYARIYYQNRLEFLNRLVLGLTPDNPLLALHKVICPNRNCWNPEHLYVGTYSDNTIDSITVGTYVKQGVTKTHCPYGHEYIPENIQWQGNKRKCRECSRQRKNTSGKRRLLEGYHYSNIKIKR